jgi:superfamily II DNA or RNA helicase
LRIPFQITVSDEFKSAFKPSYPFVDAPLSALKLDLRDYQIESIRKCISHGRGTLKLATGSGKTLLAASLISTIHENIQDHFTVLIVPNVQLIEQTYKDFIEYGISEDIIGRVSGNHEIEIGKPIIIIGSQFLLVNKEIPDILFDADLLIGDEIHGLRRDNELNKIIKKFNTPHKFGLTGTLPDDKLDEWNIIGKIGPLIYEKESYELRNKGYLAPVEANILRLHYKEGPNYSIPTLASPLLAYNEEKEFTNSNPYRNTIISRIAKKTPHNTLIIVDRIDHGTYLEKKIKSEAILKQVFFIQGDVEISQREKIRELMENNDNIICIAIAKIFATGINIKNLHYIVLAVSGKAKIRLVQSIGRLLRLNENKEKVYILDISDNLKYGKEHEEKRIKIYKDEKIEYRITPYYEK